MAQVHAQPIGAGCVDFDPVWNPTLTSSSCNVDIDSIIFDRPEDTKLQREADLSEVLRRWYVVFRDQESSSTHWGDSRQVDSLDVFISHNWSVSRADKC